MILLDPFPADAWQSYRVEIDLVADRYDLWWAPRSDPMILIGSDILFQGFVQLDHIDRFTVVHFPDGPAECFPVGVSTRAYFDNLAVTLCQADFDGNGTVDIGDFLQLLAAWGDCATPCLEDLDSSGAVGIADFLQLLADWGGCE